MNARMLSEKTAKQGWSFLQHFRIFPASSRTGRPSAPPSFGSAAIREMAHSNNASLRMVTPEKQSI